jgi:hypothetical protein
MTERRRPMSHKKQINAHPKCGIRNSDRPHTVRPHHRDESTLGHSPALHNADETVKRQFMWLAIFPVNRSEHECDILTPTQSLRSSSTSCYVPWECKIIRTNGVESSCMRRSNGAVLPSDLSAARRYAFQNKSDFRRNVTIFHSDWRDKSYACHASQMLQSAVEAPSCHTTTAIQTHSINHTHPLPTP